MAQTTNAFALLALFTAAIGFVIGYLARGGI